MFRLESTDLDVLLHPRERIVDAGGAILFLEVPGEGVIGTVALQKTGERQFELTKMGMTPPRRAVARARRCCSRRWRKPGGLGRNACSC